MNGKQRYIGLVIFLVAAISAMVWAYGFVTNRQQGPDGMSIGVVRIDDVLAFNPSYADYKQAKNELELLQRQYELEQQGECKDFFHRHCCNFYCWYWCVSLYANGFA